MDETELKIKEPKLHKPPMNRISLFLLVILAGCNHNIDPAMDPCADHLSASFEPCSSVGTVTADHCIILEALIQDQDGVIIDKFVYHYDGTNYNKIDRYYLEDNSHPFPQTPTESIDFSYNNGLISEVRFSSALLSPDSTLVTTLVTRYTYSGTKLSAHYEVLNTDGSVNISYDNEEFYLLAPKDSLYYYDGIISDVADHRALFDFKNGNLIRKGTPSKSGLCTMHGTAWAFVKNYYDDLPNVLKNYAARYPLNIGKSLYGTMSESYVEISANNIIGQVANAGQTKESAQYCWTFLKN